MNTMQYIETLEQENPVEEKKEDKPWEPERIILTEDGNSAIIPILIQI